MTLFLFHFQASLGQPPLTSLGEAPMGGSAMGASPSEVRGGCPKDGCASSLLETIEAKETYKNPRKHSRNNCNSIQTKENQESLSKNKQNQGTSNQALVKLIENIT